MTPHARLSPSAAHRWMNCPGSVELCKDIPRTSSMFADEGTAAHTLAEDCLRYGGDAAAHLGTKIIVGDGSFEVTHGMAEAVQLYLDTVREACADLGLLAIEQRVDLSWIPGLESGIVDVTIFNAKTGELHIIDLKYGAGVAVEVKDNPQLMLYASALITKHVGVGFVRTTIVQPRCPHVDGRVRTAAYSSLNIFDFAFDVQAAAGATMWPNAPLCTGDWCRFCPARATCPELRSGVMQEAAEIFGELTPPDPKTLSLERLSELLRKARLLKTWMQAIEAHAHAEACADRMPPGFKLVASRAMRKWAAGPDEVLDKVSSYGLTSDDIYETTLISPAAMDRLLKKHKKVIEPLVTKISSGTILVEESDSRPTARVSANEAFQIESEDDNE
jgi:hypothetical protein